MTYDRRHVYLQWGGTLPGNETWSCGIRIAEDIGADPLGFPTHGDIATALAGGVGTALQTFHQNSGISSPNAKLRWAKLNAIGVDGKYIDTNTIIREWNPGIGGGSPSGEMHPNQVALAITLTTAVGRGKASKGRFFMPLPGYHIDPDTGEISAANADAACVNTITFINALSNDAIGGVAAGMNVMVMSKLGAGASNEVQGVKIGHVLDTQMRRRRSLPENYSVLTRS